VIKFLLWLLLAVVSLPLALLALILYPIIWLVSLPFRLVGVSLKAVFEFIGALIKLPARSYKDRKATEPSCRSRRLCEQVVSSY
jgi:hypothetical protein